MQNKLSISPALRYNIGERLRQLPPEKAVAIKRDILQQTKVVASTYYRWLLLRPQDTGDIPGRVLRSFAVHFGVSVEELFSE